MEIFYLITLYAGLKCIYYWHKSDYGTSQTPITHVLGIFSIFSIMVFGFLIFKWYVILPIIILIACGPILTVIGFLPDSIFRNLFIKLQAQTRTNIVLCDRYSLPLCLYFLIYTTYMWLHYFQII